MKSVILSGLFCLLLSSCFTGRNYTANVIDHDYNFRGDFDKYKTYGFVRTSLDNFEMTDEQAAIIEASIESKLTAQGYRRVTDNPDLYISYMIFYDDIRIQGYNQPNFNYWINASDKNSASAAQNRRRQQQDHQDGFQEELSDEYRGQNLELHQGTLIIQMIDSKRSQTVWQGYASGIIDQIGTLYEDERNLPRHVRRILNQYHIIARGHILESRTQKDLYVGSR